MTRSSEFWDLLAPYHGGLENNFLNLPSLRRIRDAIKVPALVVGAGQGLIVAELQKKGFQCDGLDLSSEMIRYAKLRRGLTLIEGDARAMSFETGTYQTIIYATGVVDFMGDEEEIRIILKEGRRIVNASGKIFVAFYRLSGALEEFLLKVGLLRDNVLSQRKSLEIYLLNMIQMVAWVANHAGVGYLQAASLLIRLSTFSTLQEKTTTFRMQRIFRNPNTATALINAAPEKQPYRNEVEIRNLFERLAIPIKEFLTCRTCYIVQI